MVERLLRKRRPPNIMRVIASRMERNPAALRETDLRIRKKGNPGGRVEGKGSDDHVGHSSWLESESGEVCVDSLAATSPEHGALAEHRPDVCIQGGEIGRRAGV